MFSKEFFISLISAWKRLENCKKPIYIYGMGDGAEKLLDEFDRRKITCTGIFASDEFVRGQQFRGYKVLSLKQAEETAGDFVAVLGFGTSLSEVMTKIDSLEKNHELIVPEMSVIGSEPFTKEGFLQRFSEAEKVYGMLSDETSQRTFENLTAYKITGKLDFLRKVFTEKDKIGEILPIDENEVYCDLGAYTGDTVTDFVRRAKNGYKKIYAFEPDRRNFQKCVRNTLAFDNISLYNAAVWSRSTTLNFSNGAGRQGRVDAAGREVMAVSLDEILQGEPVTYIKYDVEGADREALEGSKFTIKEYSPKICTALYHRPYDYIEIPLLVNEINGGYAYYIRQERYYPAWETNLFCIRKDCLNGYDF